MRKRTVIALLCISSLAASNSAQFTGVTWTGEVVGIYSNGEGNAIGATGFTGLNSLARTSDGVLIAATTGPSQPKLISIDPLTGQGTFVNYSFLNTVMALACSPSGDMYALDSSGGGVQNDLYRLDLSVEIGCSCIKTFIGEVTAFGLTAMAFSGDGTLFAWSTRYGLMTIDPATAVATDVNGLADGSSEIQALAFAPDGSLWGIYEQLYSLDLTTGLPTPVGSGSYGNVRGLEFDPASFPSLSTTAALSPGDVLHLALLAPAGEAYALGLALDPGPICLPTLPFCLELGPTAPAVLVFLLGRMPAEGIALDLPTPPDPALLNLSLFWQALAVLPPAGPRKSNPATTHFQ
jgi:hypothetical protein